MNSPNLTQKQEGFTNDVFAEIPLNQSYKNHYDTSNMLPASIDRSAFDLRYNPKIASRLKELNDAVDTKLISNKEERLRRLTEFERENNYNKFGISRQSNLQAIDTHNKMDKIYETSPVGYQDNRVINIIVMDQKTKELMEKVKDRTGKLIEE